jgi:hypothetical protein
MRSGDVAWTEIGSANCTNAALANSADNGGNLEFLVMAQGAELPDGVAFEPVNNASTFRCSGRARNVGRAPSVLAITGAEYKDGALQVEWEVSGRLPVNEVKAKIGERLYPVDASPAVIPLQEAPLPSLTLHAVVENEHVDTKAWIINHEALARTAQGVSRQRWVERIGSANPSQLAGSFDQWLEEFASLELKGSRPFAPSASVGGGAQATAEAAGKMRDYHEVFTYSRNEIAFRAAVDSMLAGDKRGDPVAIIRALLARLQNTTDEDESEEDRENTGSHGAQSRSAQQRSLAQSRMVESLTRHVRALAQRASAWGATDAPRLEEALRLITSVVVIIGYENIVQNGVSGRKGALLDAYVDLMQVIAQHPPLMANPVVTGPLTMSLGVMGDIALQSGRQSDRDRLAKLAHRMTTGDPRATLKQWHDLNAEHADTLLTSVTNRNLFEPLTTLVERLLGIPAPYIRAQIRGKWGLLLDLQTADEAKSPIRDTLFAEANEKYSGSWAWEQYRMRRAHNVFPIIYQAQNEQRCPRCQLGLSLSESSNLRRGEPVKCQSGHIVLLRV